MNLLRKRSGKKKNLIKTSRNTKNKPKKEVRDLYDESVKTVTEDTGEN